MNKKQAKRIWGAVAALVDAKVAESWLGSQPPEAHAEIEANVKAAEGHLNRCIMAAIDRPAKKPTP